MIRIKKEVNPVSIPVLVKFQVAARDAWHKYQIIEVTGDQKNAPNQDGPILWMELAEKNTGLLAQYISLPLSVFEGRVLPYGEMEPFWENVKTIQA